MRIDVKHGTHAVDTVSITIEAAGRLWLASRANDLERSTREQYRQHVELHIVSLIGATKLNKLTLPGVRNFQDRLREDGRSPELTCKVLTRLGSLVADAQERGAYYTQPGARPQASPQGDCAPQQADGRWRGYPTPGEIRALLNTSAGRWRAFVATAARGCACRSCAGWFGRT